MSMNKKNPFSDEEKSINHEKGPKRKKKKKVKCEGCGISFKFKKDLINHQKKCEKVDESESENYCEKCDKTFNKKHSYQRHLGILQAFHSIESYFKSCTYL